MNKQAFKHNPRFIIGGDNLNEAYIVWEDNNGERREARFCEDASYSEICRLIKRAKDSGRLEDYIDDCLDDFNCLLGASEWTLPERVRLVSRLRNFCDCAIWVATGRSAR